MEHDTTLDIGSFVVTPEGRVGRWVFTRSDGAAVIQSGYDRFYVVPSLLRAAFPR